jgi:hypothetical protein
LALLVLLVLLPLVWRMLLNLHLAFRATGFGGNFH